MSNDKAGRSEFIFGACIFFLVFAILGTAFYCIYLDMVYEVAIVGDVEQVTLVRAGFRDDKTVVEFKDGRVLCFFSGAGKLAVKGKKNRIVVDRDWRIKRVEVLGESP